MELGFSIGIGAAVTGGNFGTQTVRMTQNKAMSVSVTEDGGHDLTRNGTRWILGVVGSITGIAPAQTLGTQTAQWVLSNTSPTHTMFIDALGVSLTSGTAGATGGCCYASFFQLPISLGLYAGLGVINANSGGGGQTQHKANSALQVKDGVAVTLPPATTTVWFPVAWQSQIASAIASQSLINDHVGGRLAIQPGKSLGLFVASATGTNPLYVPYMSWTEEPCSCG